MIYTKSISMINVGRCLGRFNRQTACLVCYGQDKRVYITHAFFFYMDRSWVNRSLSSYITTDSELVEQAYFSLPYAIID